MQQRGDGGRRQFFIDKMKAQQPIKISNLPVQSSGTIFLNQGSVVQDISHHCVQFQFVDTKLESISKISDILTRTSGTFTVFHGVVLHMLLLISHLNLYEKELLQTIPVQLRFLSGKTILTKFNKRNSIQFRVVNCVTSMGSVWLLLKLRQLLMLKSKIYRLWKKRSLTISYVVQK